MKNGKSILFFCVLNCISTFLIMPMSSQLGPVNGTTSLVNSSTVNDVHLYAQRNTPYLVKPSERTTIKKKSKSLAQEKNDILLKKMRDKIDKDHLQINTDDLFRSVIGTVQSLHKFVGLTHAQSIDELTTIQSYITVEDKEHIFQKLEEYHYYVAGLLMITVDAKVEEFQKIKGSTIDTVFYIPKQNGFKRMVHERALEKYFSNLESDRWHSLVSPKRCVSLITRQNSENMYATVLRGDSWFNIVESSLMMSSDSKYLRAVDLGGAKMIWDMEQGISVDVSDQDISRMQWTNRYHGPFNRYVYDNADRYTAVLVDRHDISNAIRLADSNPGHPTKNLGGWTSKAIILYSTAQKEALLVEEALDNSASKEELLALLSSKTFAAIKGFPKENFRAYITSKINKL